MYEKGDKLYCVLHNIVCGTDGIHVEILPGDCYVVVFEQGKHHLIKNSDNEIFFKTTRLKKNFATNKEFRKLKLDKINDI